MPELMKQDRPLEIEAVTPMGLLLMAVQQGSSMDTIERLAKLQREIVEYDARIAFDQAMQRSQGRMRTIGVDATNPQTHSKYATYAKLDSAIRPIYTSEGLSLSFDTGEAPSVDVVRVMCYVAHSSGHMRTYKVDMPADGKGAKGGDVMTKTHATGAAMSYGMRYLLKMIFNVAISETDDDGNGAKQIPDDEFARHMDYIEAAQDLASLQKAFVAAFKAADAARDTVAAANFVKAKDARKKAINENR